MNKSTSFRSRRKFSCCCILKALNYSLKTKNKRVILCKNSTLLFTGHPSQSTLVLVKSCSRTVFPAPLGPTSTVRGSKKVMTCLSLSSIPKLLTPKMLILSIFDIFAFWERERERSTQDLDQQWWWQQDRLCQSISLWDQLKNILQHCNMNTDF